MNHYPHHVGDYLKDTAHLSLLEHGCYRRMLDVYYTREGPLPVELSAVCRLVGATSREERRAVEAVLNEFFSKADQGWRQSRCDAEIAAFQEGAQEREEKNAHETERMRRYRERRKELFDALRALGIVPKWDTKADELQRLLDVACNGPATRTATDLQREQAPNGNASATANQNQNQNQNQLKKERSPSGSRLSLESLPDEWRAYCQSERPDLKPETVWQNFRDYWIAKPGKDATKVNWLATWRTWVRREAGQKEHSGNGSNPRAGASQSIFGSQTDERVINGTAERVN